MRSIYLACFRGRHFGNLVRSIEKELDLTCFLSNLQSMTNMYMLFFISGAELQSGIILNVCISRLQMYSQDDALDIENTI